MEVTNKMWMIGEQQPIFEFVSIDESFCTDGKTNKYTYESDDSDEFWHFNKPLSIRKAIYPHIFCNTKNIY